MSSTGFLSTVKKKGGYSLEREARRAAHSVFATIKSWMAPAASEAMRKTLPEEVSQIWSYAPIGFRAGSARTAEAALGPRHFILRVQQAGRYESYRDARTAVESVLEALSKAIPSESAKFLSRMVPRELTPVSAAGKGRAA